MPQSSTSASSKHRGLLFLLPFVAALLLRSYPYFVYHVPFSTDSWSPIRNAELLLKETPTQLGGNPVFGSYNIYWPANSIFGAVVSLVLGASPFNVMPVVFPIVGSVTVIAFFLVAEKLTGSGVAASIASLFFATAAFHAIFTAAVTKETFANPLYMICILLVLLYFAKKKSDWRLFFLFGIASVVLALAHHATMFLFLVILGSVTVVSLIRSLRANGSVPKTWFTFLLLAVGVTLVYFLIYADAGSQQLLVFFSYQNILIAISFLTLVLASSVYYTLSKPRTILPIEEGVVFLIVVVLVLLSSKSSIISLAPVIPPEVVDFAIPYLAVGFFTIIGYRIMQARMSRSNFAFLSGWLGALLAMEGFALFSGIDGGIGFVYRLFDFLYLPVAVLAGIGLYAAWNFRTRKLIKIGVALTVFIICLSTAYQTYAVVIQGNGLLGGHWSYRQSDYYAADWTSQELGQNGSQTSMSGDAKVVPLYGDYFRINITVGGYEYLLGDGARPQYLVTYGQMLQNGFVLFLYGMPLPDNWEGKLQNGSSIVYDNGNELIWH